MVKSIIGEDYKTSTACPWCCLLEKLKEGIEITEVDTGLVSSINRLG